MSDDKPDDEDGRPRPSSAEPADSADDTGLTDEQIDAEAPGVEDAAELEAAEDELAAEGAEDEEKVVATPQRRRRARIVAEGDDTEDDDEDDAPRASRRRDRAPSRQAGGATAASRPGRSRPAHDDPDRVTPSRVSAERARAAELAPKRSIGRFLREVVAELRKVFWPGRRELITYTVVVVVFVAVMVALVAGLDILFAQGVLAVFG